MRKIYLSVLTLVISLLGTLVSCEGIEPDKPEIPNFSKYYNQSGLYLGIIGFNDILEEKEFDLLNPTTVDEYKGFVDQFVTEKATLLYYAEEKALDNLKYSKFPDDLTSVSIVTFTDGLDQGSINLRKETFTNVTEYLNNLSNRIKTDKVMGLTTQPLSINSYTIGLRGSDIKTENEQQRFRENLEKLSSSENNMYEVSNMDEVNQRFKEIAKSLYSSYNIHSIQLKISSNWVDGVRFRFTFDDISNKSAENSTCYLECTIQGDGVTNIQTKGCVYKGDATVTAQSSGVYNFLKFVNITDEQGNALSLEYVKQSELNADGTWQITSEFSEGSNVTPEVKQQTAVVMLVLDCSSSLGEDFPRMQESAKNFISLLLNASEQKNTITFNANGGSGNMSDQIFEKEETKSLSYNTFGRNGYVFLGWNTKADGSGVYYSDGQSISPTEDLTLYAQWKKVENYTLSFNSNGGSGTMQSITAVKGVSTTLPNVTFTRTGYNFMSWNTKADGTGTKYYNSQNIVLTSNLTLYAQWKEVENYTLSFSSNGGSGSMQSITAVKGVCITLPNVTFTRTGYNFKSWNTKADGTGTTYYNSQNIVLTSNITLYAQWEKSVEYVTISFVANGGSGTMQSLSVEKGKTVALSNVTFTRSGYTFKSWNTSYDGSGFTYINKQTLTPNVSLTLYAQWEKTTGTAIGHEWVDLGLPSGTKWATTNVGASTPEGYGNYYAWGETSTKSSYTSSNYTYTGTPTTLPLSNDVANVMWGGDWRMPTKAEQDELRTECTWIWTTQNGVNGYKVTSKVNSNSIFLPAVGGCWDFTVNSVGSFGSYWSSSLDSNDSDNAYSVSFDSYGKDWGFVRPRCYGQSVRPVLR